MLSSFCNGHYLCVSTSVYLLVVFIFLSSTGQYWITCMPYFSTVHSLWISNLLPPIRPFQTNNKMAEVRRYLFQSSSLLEQLTTNYILRMEQAFKHSQAKEVWEYLVNSVLGFFNACISSSSRETPIQQQQQEWGCRLMYNTQKQLSEQPGFLEGTANSWLVFSPSATDTT